MDADSSDGEFAWCTVRRQQPDLGGRFCQSTALRGKSMYVAVLSHIDSGNRVLQGRQGYSCYYPIPYAKVASNDSNATVDLLNKQPVSG